jgi:flagellar hook-associated protein 2
MGSPITLSGFNQIDFNMILNAIMLQERQPVVALETEQRALEAQKTAFGTLASRLGSLESAAEALVDADAFNATAVTVSDTSRLTVTAGATTPPGSYELYVDQLARAQVSTSVQAYANIDAIAVAGAGTLTFVTAEGTPEEQRVDVTLGGDATLQQLADAINATEGVPVSASIIRNTSGQYELMLTGRETGEEQAFTIDPSAFTAPSGGGAVMTFADQQPPRMPRCGSTASPRRARPTRSTESSTGSPSRRSSRTSPTRSPSRSRPTSTRSSTW